MITVPQCTDAADRDPKKLPRGAAPSAKHQALLATYILNCWRGHGVVRDMIYADLRMFLDLGADQRAADSLLALKLYLSAAPEARSDVG